jgi:ABC-type phosphate/phosphonate transport system permease subunit
MNIFLSFTLLFKALYMDDQLQPLDTLKDIRRMMERSSRFISLSGLSGIAAGVCALAGAWLANNVIEGNTQSGHNYDVRELHNAGLNSSTGLQTYLSNTLVQIALGVLIAALAFGFFFTYLRSRKTGTPMWGATAKRLLINVSIPMLVGGIFLLKIMDEGSYGLIAPGCLIFYGLGLLNASKYTLSEVRYLGYAQILLGIICLQFMDNGLLLWALGFGVLHIVYGVFMWWKYERS